MGERDGEQRNMRGAPELLEKVYFCLGSFYTGMCALCEKSLIFYTNDIGPFMCIYYIFT